MIPAVVIAAAKAIADAYAQKKFIDDLSIKIAGDVEARVREIVAEAVQELEQYISSIFKQQHQDDTQILLIEALTNLNLYQTDRRDEKYLDDSRASTVTLLSRMRTYKDQVIGCLHLSLSLFLADEVEHTIIEKKAMGADWLKDTNARLDARAKYITTLRSADDLFRSVVLETGNQVRDSRLATVRSVGLTYEHTTYWPARVGTTAMRARTGASPGDLADKAWRLPEDASDISAQFSINEHTYTYTELANPPGFNPDVPPAATPEEIEKFGQYLAGLAYYRHAARLNAAVRADIETANLEFRYRYISVANAFNEIAFATADSLYEIKAPHPSSAEAFRSSGPWPRSPEFEPPKPNFARQQISYVIPPA